MEINIVKSYITLNLLFDLVFRFNYRYILALLFQYFEHALTGANRLLHIGIHFGKTAHRCGYKYTIDHKFSKLTTIQLVMAHHHRSNPNDPDNCTKNTEHNKRRKYAPETSTFHS